MLEYIDKDVQRMTERTVYLQGIRRRHRRQQG